METGILIKEQLMIQTMIGYTTRTPDGSNAAQFEHTFAITKDGPKILTLQRPYDGLEKYIPHFDEMDD